MAEELTEGIEFNETISYPCSQEQFEKYEKIIAGLRRIHDDFLILEFESNPHRLMFIQTKRNLKNDNYVIEIAFNNGEEHPQMFRMYTSTADECIEVFKNVCVKAELPDLSKWEDVTREIFYRSVDLNVFKTAYRVVRDNSSEIYKGFGFKHLSDVTQYYVHPDNQSYKGTTTLCQPIGEAVILFAQMLQETLNGKVFGDYYFSDENAEDEGGRSVYLTIEVPEEYRVSGVVPREIHSYDALVEDMSVSIAAYDENGNYIEGDMEHLHPLYKLLPIFLVLLGREMEDNLDFRKIMENFVENPVADRFVNLHEDFYQNHKMDEYEITYSDHDDIDLTGWHLCSASWEVMRENIKEAKKKVVNDIIQFPEDAFTKEQKTLIPHLSAEFVLPENLKSVCNAVTAGDLLAVLFHGPAGTGKTISCKLVAQATGMPIMETINCTENLDEFVLGKYIPQDDKIIFKESYVTKAIREGGAVVFEEINFAKPQYLAFLNSLLDDNGFVRLDNGEVVKRNPNFRFFATMNMGYFGTKELNQALFNRFSAIIEIAALSDEAISRMLTTRVPECTPLVDKIIGVYHKIKKKVEAEELDVVISPRNLENWVRLAKYDGYVKAAEKTIIPVAKCDRALEDTIRGIMMLYKWKI